MKNRSIQEKSDNGDNIKEVDFVEGLE